jgi:hypothetical protein
MTPDALYDEFVAGFPARKFSAGLLIAFINFYKQLGVPHLKAKSFADVLARFPPQSKTAAGKRANTLIVALDGGRTLSLRPAYNEAERFFRAEHKRFDYPTCAPHATQAWGDYRPWLDALATLKSKQLDALRERVANYVLTTLKSQAFDPASVKTDPPLFQKILESFEMTARKGEPTGAAFQGIVFGFLRADNPHLQIEIDKVRTGSKRLQRIADIDGWEGARLALSAEVKQAEIKNKDVPDHEAFANETGRRGALGVVAALSFEAGVREQLEGMGLKPIDVDDLLRIVELWDPLKQRTATASLVYYARHVEKNSSLAERIDAFLADAVKDNNDPKPTP